MSGQSVPSGTSFAVTAISRELVKIYARFYGRGPTRVRTIWRDEFVVCLLEDVFTKAEVLLVARGHFEDVRSARVAFQDEAEPLFRGAVEAATGRQVRSFLSQVAPDAIACEVFILGSASEEDQGEGDAGPLRDI